VAEAPFLDGAHFHVRKFGFDLFRHPRQLHRELAARIVVAIEALTVEICRPLKPSWVSTMRSTSAGAQTARPGKLSAAERSALNQALAKAPAFRDAGKMPEAREWAEELVRLLKSHNLLT
jgi:hypothetical protein